MRESGILEKLYINYFLRKTIYLLFFEKNYMLIIFCEKLGKI